MMLFQILGSLCIIFAVAVTIIALALMADEWLSMRRTEKRLRRRFPR